MSQNILKLNSIKIQKHSQSNVPSAYGVRQLCSESIKQNFGEMFARALELHYRLWQCVSCLEHHLILVHIPMVYVGKRVCLSVIE